jgi:hypothetical protein
MLSRLDVERADIGAHLSKVVELARGNFASWPMNKKVD